MKSSKKKSDDATLTVETTTILGPDQKPLIKSSQKKLKVRAFATEPAKVTIGSSATLPGPVQFSSIKTTIMLSVPCYLEEMLSMQEKVDKVVDTLMDKKVAAIRKDMKL